MMHKTQRDTVNVDENGLLDGGGSGMDAPPHLSLVGPDRAAHGLTEVVLGDELAIEREMRRAMKAANIPSLPLYPEDRLCRAPTTARLLEILGDLRSNVLLHRNTVIQTFHPDLSDMQRNILRLLGVPQSAYEPGE